MTSATPRIAGFKVVLLVHECVGTLIVVASSEGFPALIKSALYVSVSYLLYTNFCLQTRTLSSCMRTRMRKGQVVPPIRRLRIFSVIYVVVIENSEYLRGLPNLENARNFENLSNHYH